jgi:DNA-3-methyladenine glycosylase II
MEKPEICDEYRKAGKHLARRDPVLKGLIGRIGPCTLRVMPRHRDHFALLVRAIVAQQISSRAALAISARLKDSLLPNALTPEAILRRTERQLQKTGLSSAKARYIRDLAAKVADGSLPLKRIGGLPDEEVIDHLTQVKGIGVWTAQMFLIFSLGRLNVLPVDDFGLRAGVQKEYVLEALPKRRELEVLAEPWQPYRSVATWYFWRSRGGVAQS